MSLKEKIKMNSAVNFSLESSNTCNGECIKEMQKSLEPSVMEEFLEVVKDFHNDDKIAIRLKNIIRSDMSEAIQLLNERASKMILMVDEVFLNRRQRQSSFYRLCHQLARAGGSQLPDESKCVCFSKENLQRYNIDPVEGQQLNFSSNMDTVMDAIKKFSGHIDCAHCGERVQLTDGELECSCLRPSVSSQHKLHEAALDLCNKTKEDKQKMGSWYMTHLKRDADYYRNRSRDSSISSLNSFEVIPSPNCSHFEENDTTDNESLCSGFSIPEKASFKVDKCVDPPQKPEIPLNADIQQLSKNLRPEKGTFHRLKDNENLCSGFSIPEKAPSNVDKCVDPPQKPEIPLNDDIQQLSKSLGNKLKLCVNNQSCASNLTDARKENEQCKEEASHPASVLRQSFDLYYSEFNSALQFRPTVKPTLPFKMSYMKCYSNGVMAISKSPFKQNASAPVETLIKTTPVIKNSEERENIRKMLHQQRMAHPNAPVYVVAHPNGSNQPLLFSGAPLKKSM